MKTLKYSIAAILICFSAVSCYDLDIMPKSMITAEDLFVSDAGIKKYFAITYHDLPVEDFNFYASDQGINPSGGVGYRVVGNSNNRWEAAKVSLASAGGEANGRLGKFDGFDYWTHRDENGPYYRIREINNFLVDIQPYKDLYTPEQFEAYIAEARFLRAFYYFALAKYHGGVVLMTEPLDPKADPLTLQLPRSTEYDTYKFIYEDLKFAMENGPTDKTETVGRMNRYVAAALMTRVMLYAGTIAKYSQYTGITGPATTAGFMNMSPEYAAEFFQYVLDAKKVVDEGGYSLHTGGDKEVAFVEQFQTDTADEDIFIKQYDYLENGITSDMYLFHHWDHMVLPKDSNINPAGIGCALEPVWNLLKLYQIPAIVDEEGKPVYFDSPEAFWRSPEMEPRARATFFFSGMTEPASGQVFDFQGGYYKSFPGLAADATGNTGNRSESPYTAQYRVTGTTAQQMDGDIRITGQHGSWNSDEGPSETGFVIRKYVSNSTDRGEASRPRSIQSWKILRYGEVLMNCAEAAYELGLETNNAALRSEAFTYIAQIRDRAGAKPYTMTGDTDTNIAVAPIEEGGFGYVTTMHIDKDLQFIRDERARELAYENHHMFDMMRWRVAYLAWQNYPLQSFMPYYVDSDDAWIFLTENTPQNRMVNFDRNRYYRDIPGSVMERNKKITIKNDGY